MCSDVRHVQMRLRLNNASNVFKILRTMRDRFHHDQVFRRGYGNANPATPFHLRSFYSKSFKRNPPLIDVYRNQRA